jgi:hypothetical protein
LEKDLRPAFPANSAAGIKNLAIDCWSRNPLRRPTFSEVIGVLEDIDRKLHPKLDAGTPRPSVLSVMLLPPQSSLRGLSSVTGEAFMPVLHDMMPLGVQEALKVGLTSPACRACRGDPPTPYSVFCRHRRSLASTHRCYILTPDGSRL